LIETWTLFGRIRGLNISWSFSSVCNSIRWSYAMVQHQVLFFAWTSFQELHWTDCNQM